MFFKRYSNLWFQALIKAYFNNKNGHFSPQKKYLNQNKSPFLYTYQNPEKKFNFGIFFPTDLQNEPIAGALSFEWVYNFIIKNKPDLKEVNFLLIPLIDIQNKHWTVLKINLEQGEIVSADYYDPAVLKKPETIRALSERLPNIPFRNKLILQQFEDINCGPYIFKIMKNLAHGKKPGFFSPLIIPARAKDYRLLQQAQRQNFAEFEYDNPDFSVPKPATFYKTLLFLGTVAAFALSIGLLIAFPPAGIIAGALSVVVLSTGLGLPILATMGAALPAAIGSVVGGIYKLTKWFKNRHRSQELNYSEEGFTDVEINKDQKVMNNLPLIKLYENNQVESSNKNGGSLPSSEVAKENSDINSTLPDRKPSPPESAEIKEETHRSFSNN